MKTLKFKAGDFYFDKNGRAKYIQNDEKVAQDIAYYILKEPTLKTARTKSDVHAAISTAIGKLKVFQSSDTTITNREKISGIAEFTLIDVPVSGGGYSKTEYYFYLSVRTEAGDKVPFLFDKETYTDLTHLLDEGEV
jgi:hypothetical protein